MSVGLMLNRAPRGPNSEEYDLCVRAAWLHYGSGLTQIEVAAALGINQPKVSALLHYKLEGFSVERLMRFLTALGHDVEIVVKAKRSTRSARLVVRAA